jgi:hypothetical protein
VQSRLSLLLAGWEHLLEDAADRIWAAFAAHDATADAAKRMLNVCMFKPGAVGRAC